MEVTYIHHCGDDLTVVNAARVSFNKESDWVDEVCHCGDPVDNHGAWTDPPHTPVTMEGSGRLSDKDEGLIKFLAKHKHFSPFNHCFLTFRVKAPIFVARQLVKHEYMPWNEVSRRYVDEEPEFYQPNKWRKRAEDKKQGSGEEHPDSDWLDDDVHYLLNEAARVYYELLRKGVAPEQARMVLPQNMYTEWYWSGTLKAFAKMCSLRCKEDTQEETRWVADEISRHVHCHFPVSWFALRKAEL